MRELKENNRITLNNVRKKDLEFLYNLLLERDSRVNISHKKMPSYDEHIKFVLSKPYTKWYVVNLDGKKVGSVYLSKQDEIGIFLKKDIQGKGLGKYTLNILKKKNPRKRFIANINPKNKNSAKFFRQNGFKLIQHTYELEERNDKK